MINHFVCPRTVDEALELREKYGNSACWGGGWAFAGSGRQAADIRCVIALDHILVQDMPLTAVQKNDDVLRVGALVSLQELMEHPEIPAGLKAAAALQPSRALRCMSTLGGDVAARRDDSCMAAALTACGAVLELAGDSAICINQYVARQRRDLILFMRIPLGRRMTVTRLRRSSRGAVLLTAAVGWEEDGSNVIVAVGGPGLPCQRLTDAERLLEAQGAGADLAALESLVHKLVQPEADWLGSTAYKAHLAAVAVTDAVAACRQGRAVC